MFGESESESPRVPSPWDSLISSASPSPIPSPLSGGNSRPRTPSPLSAPASLPIITRTSPTHTIIPSLVPESDSGNVEYKLQLLNPSPARFARLVTQLKWRLLEGGGQAYYELGVADSGDLVGLPREELERTLETLEMMAGEIGASVIVVKEVEVPPALARLAKRSGDRRRGGGSVLVVAEEEGDDSTGDSSSSAFNTETEGEYSDDLSNTIVLERSSTESLAPMFTMDADSTDALPVPNAMGDNRATPRFTIDLEISSVFKPRPVRTHMPQLHNFHHSHGHHLLPGGKTKRTKKPKYLSNGDASDDVPVGSDNNGGRILKDSERKAMNRRQTRDRKREEKRKALLGMAAQSVVVVVEDEALLPISAPVPVSAAATVSFSEAQILASNEETISKAFAAITLDTTITITEETIPEIIVVSEDHLTLTNNEDDVNNDDDDDDVFGLPATRAFPTFSPLTTGESHLDVDPAAVKLAGAATLSSASASSLDDYDDEKPRLIVEALVVRKMSLEEGFLDFGGFSIL